MKCDCKTFADQPHCLDTRVFLPWIIIQLIGTPYHRGFFCNDVSLQHPYKDSTIPSVSVGIVCLGGAILTIFIIEGVHVYYDKKHGRPVQYSMLKNHNIHPYIVRCYSLIAYFLLGAACQQTIVNIGKYSIGRLRPHFFDVCKPDYSQFNCTDKYGNYLFITDDVCTSTDDEKLEDMRLSFPSGHASMSFYGAVFFVIYCQSRLSWSGSWLLRPCVQSIALWAAIITGLSRVSDYKHHWSDVLIGGLVGFIAAFLVTTYYCQPYLKPVIRKKQTDMSVLNHLEDILASHQQSNTSGSSVNHDLSDNHQNQDASATDQNNTRGDIKLKITDD